MCVSSEIFSYEIFLVQFCLFVPEVESGHVGKMTKVSLNTIYIYI